MGKNKNNRIVLNWSCENSGNNIELNINIMNIKNLKYIYNVNANILRYAIPYLIAMIGVQSLCIGSVPLGHLMGMRRCWGPMRKRRSPPLGVESIFVVPVRWVYLIQECGT